METIKKLLIQKGIKPTYQRLKILKYLDMNKTHPNVDVIYQNLVKEIPTISKTTVYNTLKNFVEKNLALCINTGTESRFDGLTENHHHFICEKCNEIYDVKIECPIFKKHKVDGHQIKKMQGFFSGVCKNCLKTKPRKHGI